VTARAVLLLLAALLPLGARAAQLNLATLSCDKYENEIVGSIGAPAGAGPVAATPGAPGPAMGKAPSRPLDAIDTVMWLFGYSVGKAGEHLMYGGDALTSFGFALDAECKDNPSTSLLEAIGVVKPNRDKPMDLMTLNCATFESRHAESSRTDPDSANTIMMWLYGYSVGQSGSHLFDPSGVNAFAGALQIRCQQHSGESLYETLSALKGGPTH